MSARAPGYPVEVRAQPGNLRAAKHGAYSDRLCDPRASEIARELLADHEHLDPRRHGLTVAHLAMLLARLERVYSWLQSQPDPVFADEVAGEVHAALAVADRWESQALSIEARLGLDPSSAARLGVAKAQVFSLARAMAEDYELEQRELEQQRAFDGDLEGTVVVEGDGA